MVTWEVCHHWELDGDDVSPGLGPSARDKVHISPLDEFCVVWAMCPAIENKACSEQVPGEQC